MTRSTHAIFRLTMTFLTMTILLAGGRAEAKDTCLTPDASRDLKVDGPCDMPGGTTVGYRNVNIVDGGVLNLLDGGDTHVWASSILVENGGALTAGTPQAPIGTNGGRVTIHLYGAPQDPGGTGVLCKSTPVETCGAPNVIWSSNVGTSPANATKVKDLSIDANIKAAYPGVKDDYFYAYHPLIHDEGDHTAYFGYKVLGVSYGGTLRLFGRKGAIYPQDNCNHTDPQNTGRSWVRLAETAKAGATTIKVETPACGLDWADKDDIVITTTDYLPGHSEQRKISGAPVTGGGIATITLDKPLTYIHNGKRFPLDATTHPDIDRVGLSAELTTKGAETRAAVGLLARSIRIVSEGDALDTPLPAEDSTECTSGKEPATNKCYFGGHTVFRQGYKTVQIQGVEFYQLGQGGRLGHYPVHFHNARKTHNADRPDLDTFVMDSSVWDSMTRWIVLHGTQDVTLARNVGYKSIGHGFYLEDATEINNKLLTNLGVFARAAVDNIQNPRKVPGILAAPDLNSSAGLDLLPYRSDYDHPTVFWITNGWNDFQYNMAAGAGTCGACYWMVNAAISTISRGEKWESYAAMQSHRGRTGMAPLKSFIGNFCTTAMTSFQTVTGTEGCQGLAPAETVASLVPIKNPLAANSRDDNYYPSLQDGGLFPTRCLDGKDCGSDDANVGTPRCGEGNPNCLVTILDRYTTSFNWAALNFAGIWLRPQWYLVTDSVITDSQQAGLTMVTGGGYEASSVVPGHWALVRKSVFIGNTQDCPTCDVKANPYASNGGPFNPSGLRCAERADGRRPINYCLSVDEGVSHQMSSFGMYQRLFSVYDGPAFQESNAYLNILSRNLDDCKPGVLDGEHTCVPTDTSLHKNSAWLAGNVLGLPKGHPDPLHPVEADAFCYMPNAAIGWKQPNGFYYPPAFHSNNLYFHNVDTRHFVITPLFEEGTLKTDVTAVEKQYCKWNTGLFNGFNSIDRQTVLNDDDGSLTGYKNTTVINLDDFFLAPVDAIQCRSDDTSRTSPYEYVSTVIYPGPSARGGDWGQDCTNEHCYGVPLYRQDLMPEGDKDPTTGKPQPRSIRMMGQSTYQRSSLTVNHGTYYLDTTVGKVRQQAETGITSFNVFKPSETYYLFLIFAKEDTEQTYRFYVGPTSSTTDKNKDPAKYAAIQIVQADIRRNPIPFGNAQDLPAGRAKWLNDDKSTGVVEVALKASDLKGPNSESLATLIRNARKNKCQPATYCTWNDTANKCQDATGSDVVCRWAVADLDCPDGGCFGIKFTMPGAFQTDPPTDPRPAAVCLGKGAPWNVALPDPTQVGGFTPKQIAGDCFQAPVLGQDFCK